MAATVIGKAAMACSAWAALAERYLEQHMLESARFYAERLVSAHPHDPRGRCVLAQCYYRQGKIKQTYMVLQESIYSACAEAKYLFALVAVALGKLQEAETVLTTDSANIDKHGAAHFVDTPGGAAGVFLLGRICRRQQRLDHASKYFLVALELDPYMWDAVVELSELGVNEPVDQLLATFMSHTVAHPSARENPQQSHMSTEPVAASPPSAAPLHELHSPPPSQVMASQRRSYQVVEQLSLNEDGTPRTAVALGLSTMSLHAPYTPTMPSPITRSMLATSLGKPVSSLEDADAAHMTHDVSQPHSAYQHMYAYSAASNASHKAANPRQLFGAPTPSSLPPSQFTLPPSGDPVTQGRRRVSFGPSARLSFSGGHKGVDSGLYSPIYDRSERSLSQIPFSLSAAQPHAPLTPPTPLPMQPQAHGQRQGQAPVRPVESARACGVAGPSLAELQRVVLVFARAVQCLHSYLSVECVEALHALPTAHLQSGLACQLLGKAYIDMNDYKVAVLAYRNMLQHEPFRVHGVEHYSTALWHLKREKELAALAQQSYETDRFAPETYCALGNFFSLVKDTDAAIRHFGRALALNKFCAYAYTLAGHEHIYNDNPELAAEHFNQALLVSPRQYNAYYGLGSIHYKQERFELAEYYFLKARAVNARSSVLDCYYAMALSAQGVPDKVACALEVLDEAIERDAGNPQLRFQRAHILLTQDAVEEALQELLLVESCAPQEPPVHALLGQVYQRLDRPQDALRHLHIAMDLDPKEAGALKAILETFEEPASTTL